MTGQDTPTQEQARRLVDLGVADLMSVSASDLEELAAGLEGPGVLAIHPDAAPASELAPLLQRSGHLGFVVADLTDLAEFRPTVDLPDRPLYLMHDVARGDDLQNWSPDEALPHLLAQGRSPLTVHEGLSWLLQDPAQLEPGSCFMTIGSRRSRPDGRLDTRTPAIWISGGTGQDGKEQRGAPKVGWCWAGNRHTWLGIASVGARTG